MAKKKTITPQEGFSEVLRCTTANGQVKVEMYQKNETIRLSRQIMADLFGVQQPAITKQRKIFLNQASCTGRTA